MAKMPFHARRVEARANAPSLDRVALHDPRPLASTIERAVGQDLEGGMAIRGPLSGRRLSVFKLPDSQGRVVDLWRYRQRLNLVLFFHHGVRCLACRSMLRVLSERASAFRDDEAAVVSVGAEAVGMARSGPAVDVAFPLLSDPSGEIAARHGLEIPSIVVSDRYGDIWAAWSAGQAHRFPTVDEIGRWLDFVELQCPECCVAEWPPAPSDVTMD